MKSGKKSEKKSKKTLKKKKLSSNITTIILILIFLVGLSVMLYPTVSNYINQRHQSKAIAAYSIITNVISARPNVVPKSAVGGRNPKSPEILDKKINAISAST